jgi:hypothetical protein
MKPFMSPIYPDVHISLRSRNRFALVSAVRYGLRRAGKPHDDIERFSREALSTQDSHHLEELCHRWVLIDHPCALG